MVAVSLRETKPYLASPVPKPELGDQGKRRVAAAAKRGKRGYYGLLNVGVVVLQALHFLTSLATRCDSLRGGHRRG